MLLGVGLTHRGKQQAKKAGIYISNHSEEFRIGILISSELKRAIQTAKPVGKILNLREFLAPEWNGLNQGLLNGLSSEQAHKIFPNYSLDKIGFDCPFPQGESIHQFCNRVFESFKKTAKLCIQENKNILICTHGANMMALKEILSGHQWQYQISRTFMPCAILEIDLLKKSIRSYLTLENYVVPSLK